MTFAARKAASRTTSRIWAIGAVVACCSLGLAACGSSSSSSGGGGGLLARIKSSHKLSIAMSAFAPQDFQAKDGTWTGYDVDILRKYAQTLGATLSINSVPFATSIEEVSSGRNDVTIDIYKTKKRAQVINFSRPMLNYNDAIAVNSTKPEISAPTVSALTGKSLAVVTGSAEVSEAQAVPHANVMQYSNINESLLALSEGRVAADIQPDTDISWSIHQNTSLRIKLLGPVPSKLAPPISQLRGYYGVPKSGSSQFVSSLNAFLQKIACNGTEQKILDKYGMKSPIYLKGLCQLPSSGSS